MAKQTFTTGQVLTAAQMTSLQQTAMLGGAASAKTASYTLVAADAGTAISMSNASATTITVNTSLFAEGDTVHITNLGAGVCTITAGTATVNSSASLALAQYESGFLDFTSTSAAIFVKGAGAAGSPSFVGALAYTNSGSVTYVANVEKILNATSEEFDTDSYHSTSSNTERMTIPAGKGGKYLINAHHRCESGGDYAYLYLLKNGSKVTNGLESGQAARQVNMAGNSTVSNFSVIVSAVATDYFYITFQSSFDATSNTWFRYSITYLGA
jgi:hypothetical protein